MERKSKKIICFSICILLLCMNFITAKAEALPDVMSGTTTLADNIMTYYALSGSAVANTDWINTLYSSYGSSFGTIEELAEQGYLVLNDAGMWEPVEQLGQMIEQAPAYSSLGLNEIFNISAEEAAQTGGYAAATGGTILAGSLGGVASTGVVPLLGGVTAAYWGGIGLGTLIGHMLGLYEKPITNGINITYADPVNLINSSDGMVLDCRNGYRITYSNDAALYYVQVGDNVRTLYHLTGVGTGNNNSVKIIVSDSTINDGDPFVFSNYNFYNDLYRGSSGNLTPVDKFMPIIAKFANATEFNNYVSRLNSGDTTIPDPVSPDVIGPNGNQKGTYNPSTGKYQVPDMKPQIDPGTQAGKPLTLEDWLAFANAVQNNNNNVNPTPDGNKGLFDDILDLIKTVIPENNPNPNPDPGTNPWTPPVVTPVPDPVYPDPVPDQQITENPQESENPQQTEDPIDTGKPWRLPDLREKFPFCIPWDIAKVFSKLKVNVRQAPHISWRFNPPNTPIDYTFNLDLEDFEPVAELLRSLELMGFIVGLAFVTRYLIGAN